MLVTKPVAQPRDAHAEREAEREANRERYAN